MMKYIYFILIFYGCLLSHIGITQTTKVLFVGNSYTFFHNMPSTFEELSIASGQKIKVDKYAKPGAVLHDHARDITLSNLIKKNKYSFVILQEQSTTPLFKSKKFYSALKSLNKAIRRQGTFPILFQTWSREYADSLSLYYHPGKFYYDIFDDQRDAQDSLNIVFEFISNEIQIPIAPVGEIFQHINTDLPDIDLWLEDHSHPTPLGSQIIAWVFYTTIFQEIPDINLLETNLQDELVIKILNIIQQYALTPHQE